MTAVWSSRRGPGPSAIAAAIVDVAARSAALGPAARTHAVGAFSWETVLPAWLGIIAAHVPMTTASGPTAQDVDRTVARRGGAASVRPRRGGSDGRKVRADSSRRTDAGWSSLAAASVRRRRRRGCVPRRHHPTALAIADGRDEFGVLAGRTASLGGARRHRRAAPGRCGWRSASGPVRVSAELAAAGADGCAAPRWPTPTCTPRGRSSTPSRRPAAGAAWRRSPGRPAGVVAVLRHAAQRRTQPRSLLIVVSVTINPIATLVVVVALGALGVVIAPLRRRIRARARSAADAQLSLRDDGLRARRAGHGDAGIRRPRPVRRSPARRRRRTATARRRALIAARGAEPRSTRSSPTAPSSAVWRLATPSDTGELGGAAAVMLVMMRSLSYGQQVQTSIGSLTRLGAVRRHARRDDGALLRASGRPAATGCIDEIGALEVSSRDLRLPTDGHDVLHDVSFRIEPGEVVGMIGPSGSGKSTLVQLLLGLREPTSGRVARRRRRPPGDRARSWTARTAFVAQDAITGVRHGGRQHRLLPRRHRRRRASSGRPARRTSRRGSPRCRADSPPQVGPRGGQLSGGQRQRLSIARALAGDPQLLVMDEPTSALDVRSESLIRRTIAELQGRVTVIIIAHRLSTLEVCDRIMVLQDGELRAMDTVGVAGRQRPVLPRVAAAVRAAAREDGARHRCRRLHRQHARRPARRRRLERAGCRSVHRLLRGGDQAVEHRGRARRPRASSWSRRTC